MPGDPRCSGATQSDPAWGLALNNTVQVGTKLSCTLNINQASEYAVSVIGFEPLMSAFTGMRVFDIIVNGERKTGIDYFRYVGSMKLYEVSFRVVASSTLNINWEASARTAVWSLITIQKLNPTAIVQLQAQALQNRFLRIVDTNATLLTQPLKKGDVPDQAPNDVLVVGYWKTKP